MLGKHIIRQFLTQIIGLATGFFISIITTRILGAQGRGDFALILNTSTFLIYVLNFSFSGALIHVISTNRAPLRNTINTLFIFIFMLIIICALLFIFFPFSRFDFLLPAHHTLIFCCSILMVLFSTSLMSTLFGSILNAKKLFRFQQTYYFFVAPSALISYSILYFIHTKVGVNFKTFMIFYTVINSIPTIGAIFIYYKHARPPFTWSFLNKEQLKYITNMSFLIYLGNLFQFFSYRMDIWFVQFYSGAEVLGIYTLAVNLAQMLLLLPQTMASIFLSYSGSINPQMAIDRTNSLCRISINIIFLVSVMMAFTIHFFIPLLYGPAFTNAAFLFQLLLIGILPFCINTILASYFTGIGLAKVNFHSALIGFIVCLIFDIILIPPFNSKGAALATIISYFFSTAYSVYIYILKTKSKLNALLIIKKDDIVMLWHRLNFKSIS